MCPAPAVHERAFITTRPSELARPREKRPQFERLLEESQAALQPFAGPDGKVAFEMPAIVVTAARGR